MRAVFCAGTVLVATALSSCGWVRWGESSPPEQVVAIASNSTSRTVECDSWKEILEGDDTVSKRTLDCRIREISRIWTQVEGDQVESYSKAELATLFRRGVIRLRSSASDDLATLDAVWALLGLPNRLTRARLDQIFLWIRANRELIRKVYQISKKNSFQENDPVVVARLVHRALEEFAWPESFRVSDLIAAIHVLRPFSDQEERRVLSGVRLLGLDKGAVHPLIRSRSQWVLDHWAHLYRLFDRVRQQSGGVRFSDIERAALAIRDFGIQVKWILRDDALVNHVVTLFDVRDEDFLRASGPLARVIGDLAGFTCPNMRTPERINSAEIGVCVANFVNQFKDGGWRYLRYLVNPLVSPMSVQEAKRIQNSLLHFRDRLQRWYTQPGLRFANTQYWLDLSASLRASPPPGFINSLKIFNLIDPQSTQYHIHPNFMGHLVRMLTFQQFLVLDGLPVYTAVFASGKCANKKRPSHWRSCYLKMTPEETRRAWSIDFFRRIHNVNYGGGMAPYSGKQFKLAMFFYAAADEIMRYFDKDGDQLISTSAKKQDNEIYRLFSLTFEAAHILERFVDNFRRKLEGLPIDDTGPLPEIAHIQFEGLARLITLMGSDVLVRRPPKSAAWYDFVRKKVLDVFPESSVTLDRESLAAALMFLDTTGLMTPKYLRVLGVEYERKLRKWVIAKIPVSRAQVVKKIPEMIRVYFPRTFESCTRFETGFGPTCGVAFDEILPLHTEHPDWIPASDMKLITVLAATMENLFDSCNTDADRYLSANFIEGGDELDCAYTRFTDMGRRMIESGIIKDVSVGADILSRLADFLDQIALTRTFGKVAMIRGSSSWMPLNLFLSPFYYHASLGSMYGLLSDLIDPEQVSLAKKRAKKGKP